MRYMMLIHNDDEAIAAAPQQQALYADYAAFGDALQKAGGTAGMRLKPSHAATTVRIRDGQTDLVDGPYADTKEQLAGYFLIDADTLDEAIAWARRCPSARYGAIEIRPLVEQNI